MNQLDQHQRGGQVRNLGLAQHGDKGRIITHDGIGFGREIQVQGLLLPLAQALRLRQQRRGPGMLDLWPDHGGMQ